MRTSWTRRRLEDVLKPSWKRIEDVLKTYDQDKYTGLDQDVLWERVSQVNIFILIKTSWRRRWKTSSRPLQKVFTKTNIFWEVMSLNQWVKDTNLSNWSVLRVYCHFLLGNIYIYISQALQLWKPFKVIFSCEI